MCQVKASDLSPGLKNGHFLHSLVSKSSSFYSDVFTNISTAVFLIQKNNYYDKIKVYIMERLKISM